MATAGRRAGGSGRGGGRGAPRLPAVPRPAPVRQDAGRTWADPDAFLSDSSAMRAEAARACRRCPVRALCGEYAETADERFGVWGGQDRTL
ncbi:MAG: WhiB family transcriptional regulator [Actinomycetota bacterium]